MLIRFSMKDTKENLSNKNEDLVGACCVCSDDQGFANNALVYCDGKDCTVACHTGKNKRSYHSRSIYERLFCFSFSLLWNHFDSWWELVLSTMWSTTEQCCTNDFYWYLSKFCFFFLLHLAMPFVSVNWWSNETHVRRRLGTCYLRTLYTWSFVWEQFSNGTNYTLENSIDTLRTNLFDLYRKWPIEKRCYARRLLWMYE